MLNPRRKQVLAAAFLPAYAVLWITGVTCSSGSSGGADLYPACFTSSASRSGQVAVPGDGFELPTLQGDVVFGGVSGQAIANKKRTEIVRMTFGVPASFPAGDLTLSGAFESQSRVASVKRPRKVFLEVADLDVNGQTRSKITYPLKVKGDQIKSLTKAGPEMLFGVGESMAFFAKPKGADLSLEERIQLFYEMSPNAGTVAGLARRLLSGDPMPGTFRPVETVKASAVQEIVTSTFGIDVDLPRWQIIVGGNFQAAAALAEGSGRPTQFKITVQHLDSAGAQKKKFVVKARVNGDTIAQTQKRFPGFSVKAGDSVRLTLQPKGGDLEAGDELAVFVIWFP